MGSNVSVGLVYNGFSNRRIKEELDNIFKYLCLYDVRCDNLRTSKDIEGEDWVEHRMLNTFSMDSISTMLAKGYYGQLDISGDILDSRLVITIRIEKEKTGDYFGFLFDINEDELIKDNSLSELNKITEEIIGFMTEMYRYSNYDYAICDNEARIKYSPGEFRTLEEIIYSVSVKPHRSNGLISLVITKGDWNIDGLTSRN